MFESATVKVIDAAVAAGELSLEDARAIFARRVRLGNGSAVAKRSAAWLRAHRTVEQVAKGEPAKAARASGIGSRGGDVAWGIAGALAGSTQGWAQRKSDLHTHLSEAELRVLAAAYGVKVAA